MKQLIIISQTVLALSFLSGCGSATPTAPSQNSALNSISKSNAAKEKKGIMQESLDSWLESDWTPTIQKNKKIQDKYMERQSSSTASTNTNNSSQESNLQVENKDSGKKEKTTYVEKKDKPFTLQEYVDKAEAYMDEKPNDYKHSNVKKLESLPAIGK